MDGKFDKLEEMVYVEKMFQGSGSKFFGEVSTFSPSRLQGFDLPTPLQGLSLGSNLHARVFGKVLRSNVQPLEQVTQKMVEYDGQPGSNDGTGLLQTICSLKVRTKTPNLQHSCPASLPLRASFGQSAPSRWGTN